ncbi:transposase [Streptosporangium sp. NPDC006007]|uniref:transposase n=1 Tax=Streptosporangium sp. NPDC006007 TaxID=3154575 RepID=UPI0033BDC72A
MTEGVLVVRLKSWDAGEYLWTVIQPLLPRQQRRTRHSERERPNDHPGLEGILFVLHTGVPASIYQKSWSYGSRMTCRRRPAEWRRPARSMG